MDVQLSEEFSQLLRDVLSEDNTARQTAEEKIQLIPPQAQILLHLNTICTNMAPEIRQMSCVLLRQLIVSQGDKLAQEQPESLEPCKLQLLQILQSESVPVVRRKVCDAVAELARLFIDENDVNHWPEVLQFLFQSSTAEVASLRENALHIIKVFPLVFGDKLQYYTTIARQLFWQTLNDSEPQVQQAAVMAVCSFIENLTGKTWKPFQELLPAMLLIIERAIVSQDDTALLKSFIEMCETSSLFIKPHFNGVLELMIKSISSTELTDSFRQLALEVTITLSESIPALMRKQTKFMERLVQILLQMMVEVEEDEDWESQDCVEEEDTTCNAVVAETSLDRMACALGGRTLLPHILSNVPQMLSHESWQYRQAALNVLAATAEGCQKHMLPLLDQVVTCVLPLLQDSHPRVRYSACNCIGQLSSDFPEKFQSSHHITVVPALITVLNDSSQPRVQAHCAAALTLFCEDCPQEVLAPYLVPIVEILSSVMAAKLQELVTLQRKIVLEGVLTALAAVAESVEEMFMPYYDQFMPSLKFIVQNATSRDLRLLRGKAIECISLVGLAVGKEKFMQDASEIMAILLKAQTEQDEYEPDDPQISYMMSSWARMCKLLQQDFVKFLPVVMNPLIKAASHSPELALIPSTEETLDDDDEDGWEFITLSDKQKFGIKTAGLEEKATACQMLVIYARDLKEGFSQYAEQVCKLMIPHLKFLFHEMVRACAAESLPLLLECVKDTDLDSLHRMWNMIRSQLLEAITLEPDEEIHAMMLDSLCKCIDMMGANCFTAEQYQSLIDLLKQSIATYAEKARERMNKRSDEDIDEETEDSLLGDTDAEETILTKVSDLMHSLFSTHESALLPFFNQLLPSFSTMLGPDRPKCERQWAICIFDDLVEFASDECHIYKETFITHLQTYVNDPEPEIRQAAAYGLGIMSKCPPEHFGQTCIDSLACLSQCISREGARASLFDSSATDNAISAVAKICKHLPHLVQFETILPHFLSWLPIVEDREEAVFVYSYLCELIEGNNEHILGQNNSNLPRIVAIFAESFRLETTSEDMQCHNRMLTIIQHIHTSPPVWELCSQYLNQEQRQALSDALTNSDSQNSF
ncbi:Importin-5-like [Oopsacas minuta]|uniref:Importin-5-like n=1 Tax=Oopsacas minuta TaxID=111878 RepID=A0AAV7JP63_9METZ|nr:Importin-5-like [Oopsacas minuta]